MVGLENYRDPHINQLLYSGSLLNHYFPFLYFCTASTNHNTEITTDAIVESHNSSVAYVTVKTASTTLVTMLVDSAGFSLPRIVGMSAITNIHIPTERTISCHTIFTSLAYGYKKPKPYVFKLFLLYVYGSILELFSKKLDQKKKNK